MAMMTHLRRGCVQCQRAVEVLQRVAAVSQAETCYPAPSSVVRRAKAIFALRKPQRASLLPRLKSCLTFDSFLSPLPAGVRSRQGISRQVLYRAGNFSLDLRLDQDPGSPHVVLVGQIANAKDPAQRLSDLPVFLVRGKEVVAQTVSNRWGEFQMECPVQRHLRLWMPIPGATKRIEISLSRVMPAIRPAAHRMPARPAVRRGRRER